MKTVTLGGKLGFTLAGVLVILGSTARGASAHDMGQATLHLSQSSRTLNQVSIEQSDGYRYIDANGIPDHATGAFPNTGNPNSIAAQSHRFRVTLTPQLAGRTTPVRPTFGVALNGVPFEPGTGEYWNRDRTSGWNYDALSGNINLGIDMHNAHVQPTGSYHYHGLPTGLLQRQSITLVGYAADGFPVYGQYGYTDANDLSSDVVALQSSYRLRAGQRPSGPESGPGGTYDGTFVQDFEYVAGLGDLDECNGRFGVTPEYPEGIYHYTITEMFPFIPRCVKGVPDESFQHLPENPSEPGNRPGNRPEGDFEPRPEGKPPSELPPRHHRRPPLPPPRRR
ncbi:MAG: YHYH protein [Cyanobacteria bacterium J06635_1]